MPYYIVEAGKKWDEAHIEGPFGTLDKARKAMPRYLEELALDCDDPDWLTCHILQSIEEHKWKKPKMVQNVVVTKLVKPCSKKRK